ncbi:lachesin-like [Agrilus planipennis]|uniref:Lachesin-like n=1 Tax=Agrilus planipennis TaxID=224129 RepID=A0A7F5RBF1_AGRPL|nr:lachesin-like [Agrilus planipennis]
MGKVCGTFKLTPSFVSVPPDILDHSTSSDVIVREGASISLRCAARGSPEPTITWKRENNENIYLPNGQQVASFSGPVLNITQVSRRQMGHYLCIASNGVPPSVSKRITVIVNFPPMIWIQNQLIGAHEGQMVTLECHSEAYPKSINYWTKDSGDIIAQSAKYEPTIIESSYKVQMKLAIKSLSHGDYGSYKCVAKNSLGDTDGTIRLVQIARPTAIHQTTGDPDGGDMPPYMLKGVIGDAHRASEASQLMLILSCVFLLIVEQQ